MNGMLAGWKQAARKLKRETAALYYACRDPRVPWYAKAVALVVVAYALSPIDLIPDFIPILGYLDDLLLVPLGIALALRLIPPAVMEECRQRAAGHEAATRASFRWMGALMVAVWVMGLVWGGLALLRAFHFFGADDLGFWQICARAA